MIEVRKLIFDPYAVLGVEYDATTTEIGAQFRVKVKQWHPDVCPAPDATEKMKDINAAWTILKDPVTRNEWDEEYGGYARLISIYSKNPNPHTKADDSSAVKNQTSPSQTHEESTSNKNSDSEERIRTQDRETDDTSRTGKKSVFWNTYTGDLETSWHQHREKLQKETDAWTARKSQWDNGEGWWGWWTHGGLSQKKNLDERWRKLQEDWNTIQTLKKVK